MQRNLIPFRIDVLPEITLLVKQPDAHHRNPQIARRLEMVASHVTQSARVDGQRIAQHIFHAEVSDCTQPRIRLRRLKPALPLVARGPFRQDFLQFLVEAHIGERRIELWPRYSLQHQPCVVRQIPEFGIKLSPEFVRGMIPRRAQIERQFRDRLQKVYVCHQRPFKFCNRVTIARPFGESSAS
jgi:hypothetical protein